jgi:hypothetical protein
MDLIGNVGGIYRLTADAIQTQTEFGGNLR